jgi:hypothetical protein
MWNLGIDAIAKPRNGEKLAIDNGQLTMVEAAQAPRYD